MIILALESSGLVASAALVSEDKLIGEYTTNFKKTHSQTLLPMMDALLKMTGIDISQIDAFAVSGGPGSFTGLRIGSATVKGLAMATGKPVINVPTLEGLACNFFGTDSLICPLMDARRNQTYTGIYAFEGDELICLSQQKAVKIEEILEEVNALGRKVIFLGDGVPVFKKKIEEIVTVPWQLAPPHLAAQRAGAVGVRAITYYKEGKTETAAQHKPEYLRLSQAERERMEKAKA